VDYNSILAEVSNKDSKPQNLDSTNLYTNPAPDTVDINELVDQVAGVDPEEL
jgi:hypothetical protein